MVLRLAIDPTIMHMKISGNQLQPTVSSNDDLYHNISVMTIINSRIEGRHNDNY